MIHRPSALTCALLLFSAAGSLAASGVDLGVAGRITPGPACEMTVGTGIVDFGRIARGDLNPDPSLPTALGEQRIKMNIVCANPMRYATVASGASRSATHDDYDFGLVSDGGQSTAGKLYVRYDSWSAHIEGAHAYYTASASPTDLEHTIWGPSTGSVQPIPNGAFAIGFVADNGSDKPPSPIKHFDTYLLLNAHIKPVNELDLSNELTFSGDLGFEIRYF